MYIGQSIDLYKRFHSHRYTQGQKSILKLSLLFYGYSNHKFEIIEECRKDELFTKEMYWQEYYDSYNVGLNSIKSNGNNHSGSHSEYSKNRISNSKKGCRSKLKGKPSGMIGFKKERLIYENPVFDNLTGVFYRNTSEAASFNDIKRITLHFYLSGRLINKKPNLSTK